MDQDREDSLLVACARPRLDAQAQAVVAEMISAGPDWTALVSRALDHGVTPALLAAFESDGVRPSIPAEILSALREYRDMARARNTDLASELLAILSALARIGVAALPFKGPVLAEYLYGDLGQRAPGDIDVLVRLRDVTAFCEILASRGYRDTYETSAPMTALQHRIYRRYQCEYQFVRDSDGVVVEPHWAAVPAMRGIDLDYEAQFARARQATLVGSPVSIHAPEDLLLFLCAHGAKHQWARLAWIRDLATLVERRQDLGLDLDTAVDRARNLGYSRMVLLGLEVGRRLLDVEISPGVRDVIARDRGLQPLVATVVRDLFRLDKPELKEFWVDRFSLSTHERVANRLRHVARTLLLPRREHLEMVVFPAALGWAYYPLRWGHDYVAHPLWMLTKPLRRNRRSSLTAA